MSGDDKFSGHAGWWSVFFDVGKICRFISAKLNDKMETEINQYLAEQRGLAEEQRQERRDR